ncbi:hypothetical protein Gotri_000094 [Gossypium trilobum]|uniref:Uncharacterized protein n=1 Tax=Gossypium trilobum TaxID=34281 RepID=A0A7J9FJC0_9ROSI|nr:hypothetical protein [Gossypium trilobum]
MEAFHSVLDSCELHDLDFEGRWDRFPASRVFHAPHSVFDHCSLVIIVVALLSRFVSRQLETMFHFESHWVFEPSCEEEIQSVWTSSTGSVPIQLGLLGVALSTWGRTLHRHRSQFV